MVDTEVILPVSPTDKLGWQHLKMLLYAGFQGLLSPQGLSNAYRDLPAQDRMTLVRWPISWSDHVQDIYPFSVGPVMCCPSPRSFMGFLQSTNYRSNSPLTQFYSLPSPVSWCYVSPRNLKPSVSECCLYFPVATRTNPIQDTYCIPKKYCHPIPAQWTNASIGVTPRNMVVELLTGEGT